MLRLAAVSAFDGGKGFKQAPSGKMEYEVSGGDGSHRDCGDGGYLPGRKDCGVEHIFRDREEEQGCEKRFMIICWI